MQARVPRSPPRVQLALVITTSDSGAGRRRKAMMEEEGEGRDNIDSDAAPRLFPAECAALISAIARRAIAARMAGVTNIPIFTPAWRPGSDN